MAKRITRKQMEEMVFKLTGRRHKIPPPDSELWPPSCRGKEWDWGFGHALRRAMPDVRVCIGAIQGPAVHRQELLAAAVSSVREPPGRTVYMHREVTGAPKGQVVDHVNHNTMNNRRCNVRICTDRQNQANKRPHGGSTGYVGVYPRDGRYEAGIT